MKLKSLLLITLFVVACGFASAQTFGFASSGGTGVYCNYEQLIGGNGVYWTGTDNLSACGLSYNAVIAGFTATVPGYGPGVVYGDNIYALEGDLTAQYAVWTSLKASKQNKEGRYIGKYGWVGIVSFSGVFAGDNYGYLTATIPSKTDGSVALLGTTADSKASFKK